MYSTVWCLKLVRCFHCVFAAVFDRQYMAAYEHVPERDLKLYQRCDKPPSDASLYCRHYFKELELWHDMKCLDAVSRSLAEHRRLTLKHGWDAACEISVHFEKQLLDLSCLSIHLSAHVKQLGFHLTDFDEIRDLSFFWKYVDKIKVLLKCDENTKYFTWRHFHIMMISRWILLRMGSVWDKSCRENQNTHFLFNNFFLKIMPFMR
jgi:hypothetical protein